jgi:CheY-like chemotaxis protein
VVVASNGFEAVRAVATQPFDIVLMDIQMPLMDGIEATRVIREQEGSGRIPIVAQTALAFADDRKQCMEAGMDDYITKPIKASALLKVMGRLLSPRKPGSVSATKVSNESHVEHVQPSARHIFDVEALRKRLGGNEGSVKEMVQVFFSYTPQLIADVHEAARAEDCVLLTKLSHTLKGGSATFGADRLADVAREIELTTKATGKTAHRSLLSRLDSELESLKRRVADLGYTDEGRSLDAD